MHAVKFNEKTQYHGKPCFRGHTLRYIKTNVCIECQKIARDKWLNNGGAEYAKAWAAENKDKRLEAARRWREKNPERASEVGKNSYRKHREKRLEADQAFYSQNQSRILAKQRESYLLNKDAINERRRAWCKANPAYIRAKTHQRRDRKRTATVSWGQDGIKEIYMKAKLKGLSVDHIIPLKHNLVCGLHVIDNLQIMSIEENIRKGNSFEPFVIVSGAS